MQILGDTRVDAVRIVRNHLVLNADGQVVTHPTTDTEVLQTSWFYGPSGIELRR